MKSPMVRNCRTRNNLFVGTEANYAFESAAKMKECVWLKPKLVAQIEFAEWTPDNHLRHSKFIGLREDKEAREVLWDKVMTKNH